MDDAVYQLPCCSHIHIDFVFGAYQRSHPMNEVVITASDHRRRSLFRPRLKIPRPPSHCSPNLFYAFIQTLTEDYCRRQLNLPPCCVDALLPVLLDTVFTVVNGFHGLPGLIPIELHIIYRPQEGSAVLRESFEAASPKPTPASMGSILKLVEDNMKTRTGDDDDWENTETCTICLDEIGEVRAVKMPCSHVFHQDCIVSWLKNSHLCPLCRYEMPV